MNPESRTWGEKYNNLTIIESLAHYQIIGPNIESVIFCDLTFRSIFLQVYVPENKFCKLFFQTIFSLQIVITDIFFGVLHHFITKFANCSERFFCKFWKCSGPGWSKRLQWSEKSVGWGNQGDQDSCPWWSSWSGGLMIKVVEFELVLFVGVGRGSGLSEWLGWSSGRSDLGGPPTIFGD